MKLNNKGLTLVELIISIVLIVVVMLFMYKLLSDVNNEKNDDSYAQQNRVIRAEIIKKIEDDIFTKKLTNITDESTSGNLKIRFSFEDGTTSRILATSSTLTYEPTGYVASATSGKNAKQKWTMKECSLNVDQVKINYKQNNNIFSILLNIEVYTGNDFNRLCKAGEENCQNNVVDDISLSYTGTYNTIIENNIAKLKCLGKGC